MSKNKGYWVRIQDMSAIRHAIYAAVASYKCPIVKVRDCDDGKWVDVIDSLLSKNELGLLKEDVEPLSYADAITLDMDDRDKKFEICVDCLMRECKQTIDNAFRDLKSGRVFLKRGNKSLSEDSRSSIGDNDKLSHGPISMNFNLKEISGQWLDSISGLKNNPAFTAEKQEHPDEIDLYNFFEKWHGIADMSKIVNGITPYDYRTVHETVGDIVKYLNDYQDYNKVEYFIDDNCYHAIRFKDRGTFLVSERRYQELKKKKYE